MSLVVIVSFSIMCCATQRRTNAIEYMALTGAKIYTSPFNDPILDGTVLIRGESIDKVGEQNKIKIPAGVKTIDCSGMVIMAGFWNNHVHFMEAKWNNVNSLTSDQFSDQMEQMLTRYGFTYAFDLACLDFENMANLLARSKDVDVRSPTVLSAGVPFTPPNGNPFYINPLKLPEARTPEEAKAYVLEQKKLGANGIKIWSASPNGKEIVPMPLDIVREATRIAHESGLPVFAHPTSLEGVRIAAEGRVDVLAHVAGADYKDWDSQTLATMVSNNMALIPTLQLHKWELERGGLDPDDHPLLDTAINQLATFHRAGGEVLFGTDVGFMRNYDLEDEYILMHRAGLDYRDILESLTTAPAKRFGGSMQVGRVAKNYRADLAILESDPAVDVRNFTKVKYTIHKGKIIYD